MNANKIKSKEDEAPSNGSPASSTMTQLDDAPESTTNAEKRDSARASEDKPKKSNAVRKPGTTARTAHSSPGNKEESHTTTPASTRHARSGEPKETETNSKVQDGRAPRPAPAQSDHAPSDAAIDDHPFASVFPLMEEEELQELADDIRQNGLRELIILFDGKILDGRNRHRACIRSNVKPQFVQFEGRDPAAFVLSKNLRRRDLTKSQRAAIAVELLPIIEAEARQRRKKTHVEENQRETLANSPQVEKIPPTGENETREPSAPNDGENQKSRDVAAKALDVNARYVSDAKLIKEEAPELHEQVKQGKITLAQAKKLLAKTKPKKKTNGKNLPKPAYPQPFTVVFWDETSKKCGMPKILKDKKQKKTLPNAIVFHLTGEPKLALGSESKDGFYDAALFVIPVDDSAERKADNGDGHVLLQKPSCLFLVARTCGEVPDARIVPDPIINGDVMAAREIIEKMWPSAHRIIFDGNETPPEGWHKS